MKPRRILGFSSLPARMARIQVFALALCALLTLNALAFSSFLQPEEVREAYYLGQTSNHEDLAEFLNQYEHDFKYPSDNPTAYVSTVEFQTPYEQIVLRSLRTTQYTKFQADEDYAANPGLVIVRVVASLKTSYSGPAPPADSFKVAVNQVNSIEPRKITSTLLCDPTSWQNNATYSNCFTYTREIVLQFDAEQFAPGKATVKIALPFGQSLETKYNLDKLK
jgi:hypothetical protein